MTDKKLSNDHKSPVLTLSKGSRQHNSTLPKDTAPREKISYSIAHVIPGRIRFHIPRLGKDAEYAEKLKSVIQSTPNITDVRINPAAASIVIKYQPGTVSDQEMRSHLVNLIQTAPNIVVPQQGTAQTFVGAIFDALTNVIDSIRNINKARSVVVHQPPKTNTVERMLSGAKKMMNWLKSAMMFALPKRSPVANSTFFPENRAIAKRAMG
jgi:copper chaperone CopZ